jgi:hypothetical protein
MAALRDAALQEERRQQQQHSRAQGDEDGDDSQAAKPDGPLQDSISNPWFPAGVSTADLLPSPFAVNPVLVENGGGRKGNKGSLHPRR